MKTIITGLLASLALAVSATGADPASARVLLVTGIDYPGHKWRETTPVLVEALTNDERLRVDVLEDPYRLDTTDLSPYRAVFLHFMNWEKPDPNEKAKENLRSFVERGGGMVMIHFACGAFQGWPEFRNLAGRIYDRTNTHDPRGPFTVEVAKTNHPITRGLASFGVDDELYICLTGEKPIDVLATARSKITKRDHPMAFVHSYGKGRVFQTPLGHDVKALRSGRTLELIRRGTLWAAGVEDDLKPRSSRREEAHSNSNGGSQSLLTSAATETLNRAEIERTFKLPPGFSIQLIASEPDIANPMTMCVDELGALWVTEAHTYRWGTNGSPFQPPTNPIKRIELGPDGRAARTTVAAEGFPEPVIGLCVRNGKLYATCLNELFVMDIAPDGKLANRRLLVKDAAVPWNPFGMYRVQIGPDDKLWLCIADHPGSEPVTLTGSDGRVVRLAGKSGGMVRCNRDGSGLEVIVQGFRAPYAFDFDPWGHLWHISNGEGSPNLYVHVIPGMDYGYASRQASYAWMAGQEPLSPPVRDLGAGANTAALHYYSSQFPREYWGNIFIANWGSHGANPANRDLRRFRRAKDGHDRTGTSDTELIEVEKFLTTTDPMFRPTGLALAPDGGLYLIDWHGRDDENDITGRIFKILYSQPSSSRREEAHFKLGARNSERGIDQSHLTSAATEREILRLGDPNHVVREMAQRALAHAGERALEPLGHAAATGEPLAAASAVWTLTRIHSQEATYTMTRALKHPDARVRAHALRQLRQAAGQTLAADAAPHHDPLIAPTSLATLAAPLLQDPDAEVRVEAALAQDSSAGVTQGLLAALAAAPDARLVYQIGMQLGRRGDARSVLALVRSTNPTSQRAGLVALDTARHERTPLAARVKELEPQAMEEVPPPGFSQKLAWLQRHKPELLAAEFARLERGELLLTTPAETLAALACLELRPQKKLPAKFLAAGLDHADPRVQQAALRVVRQSPAGERTLLAPTLKILHSTKTPATRLEAIYALGSFGNAVSTGEWLGCVQSAATNAAAAALRSMRQVEHAPELAKALLEVAPSLVTRQPDLGEDLLFTLRALGVQAGQCESLPIKANAPKTKSELTAAVLARLPNGSATLGRLSFHSARAGCAKCHSPNPGESPFGPSLADIGAASQPQYLIESILEPGKVIKTGYQTETIETSDGRVLSGLIEASGGELLVKSAPGEQVAVPLDQVKSRVASQVSPMPEGLEAAMSEAELADLVAWMRSLKTQTVAATGGLVSGEPTMQARRDEAAGRWDITDAGQPVLGYNYQTNAPGDLLAKIAPGNLKYARARGDYIHPLHGLNGAVLTMDWPLDHPHHRGIYWAWPEVDYHGQHGDLHALQHVFARPTGNCVGRSGPAFAEIEAENLWRWEDAEPIVRERVLIRAWRADAKGRFIDLEFQFTSLKDDVAIARRETKLYGGLNIRLACVADQQIDFHTDPVAARPRAAWANLTGTFAGWPGSVGLAVFQNPANPDYPGDWVKFPEINWLQPCFPAASTRHVLKKDEPLVLRFRLWIHGGKASDAELAAMWSDYANPAQPAIGR